MQLNQSPVIPENPLPIVIIGAGGIVRDAHLPAYAMAQFPVAGIYDLSPGKAKSLAETFGMVQGAFDSLDLLLRKAREVGAVFDLAVPADQILEMLPQLPDGSAVLIQKPMGENLKEAGEIRDLCRKKSLVAAINFQLRHAPFMLAAKDVIRQGLIGEVFDMEFKVCVYTPWELWEFLKNKPRLEILYHSIHYVDTVRDFFGDPAQVYANTIKHPNSTSLAATRSTIVLDYDRFRQARILTNHGHDYGSKHQESYLKIEGTEGAIKIQIGVSFDYPKGRPSKFEYYSKKAKEKGWQELPLTGDWFPQAFIGPMASLQNHLKNPSAAFPNAVEDAFQTMRLVEKLYESSEQSGLAFD
ncbi:Gfo/Idh/MocA family protein [Cyclobacterium jeungdonense]|uniref:Gfo/Idh/MocA family oxidoreductase n=1 Tax=Cyclobacterium jeungdonense TaxID=708087 RepID=A0ABT8C6X3_9BACT|nr:Gfo/Idh/MocA family oxidoreductase [Cyclobacterium jeungdonense]MDN3688553.1 Gfo/Idh/MocA family oxidoreductase [Cyclobacterium jeungdonense]